MDKNRFFFQHYGLTERDLEHYLGAALSAGGDYADLYFEYLSSTSLMVDESMVKSASQGISAGCGVRVIFGERTGYAYTDDLSPERILHAARTAALIASGPAKTPAVGFQEKQARSLYPITLPSVDAEITAKVELVMRADKPPAPTIRESRKSAPATATNCEHLCSRLGWYLCRRFATPGPHECLYRQDGRQLRPWQLRRRWPRRPRFFLWGKDAGILCKESARQAILQLDAREAPAGETAEVVLGPGWPGVLLHEAVGHGLEADFNRKQTSAFAGLIGKHVASEKCTVVDNGTMPWRRGSLNVDDEGNSTQETVLIENGILKGYLSDKLSARLMDGQHRQRTPRKLRTHPHAAHDQHLYAARRRRSAGYYSLG